MGSGARHLPAESLDAESSPPPIEGRARSFAAARPKQPLRPPSQIRQGHALRLQILALVTKVRINNIPHSPQFPKNPII